MDGTGRRLWILTGLLCMSILVILGFGRRLYSGQPHEEPSAQKNDFQFEKSKSMDLVTAACSLGCYTISPKHPFRNSSASWTLCDGTSPSSLRCISFLLFLFSTKHFPNLYSSVNYRPCLA